MIKRSLRAFWFYVTLACVALGFMIAGIVFRSLENNQIRDFQAYIATNCIIEGYHVNGSQNAWYVQCQFDLQPEGECCIRAYYLPPPTGSFVYLDEESAIANAPTLCPDNAQYLCWYDSRDLDNDILLSPPSITDYDIAIIVCFTLMAVIVLVGIMLRLGCCPCVPWFNEKKPPKNVSKSDEEQPKMSFKLKRLKPNAKKPKSTSKSSTEISKSSDKTADAALNKDQVALDVVDAGENGTPDQVQTLEVTDGNAAEDSQDPQMMDEIPLNVDDEQQTQTTTSVDLNVSDDSDSM